MCSIGDRIKALRLERKMTQAQLAEKLGVSYQAVSKWENGITSPDISLIPNITRAFSISADILFDLVNPEARKEEIYVEYKDIFEDTSCNRRARKLLERAAEEFPAEYKFYIMLGNAVCNCIDDQHWTPDNDDIQYALKCYDKVLAECDDSHLVECAKVGRYVITNNFENGSKDAELDLMTSFSGFMRIVDPKWGKAQKANEGN